MAKFCCVQEISRSSFFDRRSRALHQETQQSDNLFASTALTVV